MAAAATASAQIGPHLHLHLHRNNASAGSLSAALSRTECAVSIAGRKLLLVPSVRAENGETKKPEHNLQHVRFSLD